MKMRKVDGSVALPFVPSECEGLHRQKKAFDEASIPLLGKNQACQGPVRCSVAVQAVVAVDLDLDSAHGAEVEVVERPSSLVVVVEAEERPSLPRVVVEVEERPSSLVVVVVELERPSFLGVAVEEVVVVEAERSALK